MSFTLHFKIYLASSELHAKCCAIRVRSVGQMEGNAQIVNNNHANDNKHANYNCLLAGAQSLIFCRLTKSLNIHLWYATEDFE